MSCVFFHIFNKNLFLQQSTYIKLFTLIPNAEIAFKQSNLFQTAIIVNNEGKK